MNAGSQPIAITSQTIVATAGIGVAYSSSRTSEERLCASADSALYVAKAAGRNTFHVAHIEGDLVDPLAQ